MSSPTVKVNLLTGGNRGIGFVIVQALASYQQNSNATFLLGGRDLSKGEAATTQLRDLGVTAEINPFSIDITSDISISNAVSRVEKEYGQLDILTNNAGIAIVPKAGDCWDWRPSYQNIHNSNITSIASLVESFLPLLRKTSCGKIINVSSGRSSISNSGAGKLPPTVSIGYSISKTALHALAVEMSRSKENNEVEFQRVNAGHCHTEFNSYRGTRDPLEGASTVVELDNAEMGRYKNGFWQTEGGSRELIEVPW